MYFATQFLYSKAHIPASWHLETRLDWTLLRLPKWIFFLNTLHGPCRKHGFSILGKECLQRRCLTTEVTRLLLAYSLPRNERLFSIHSSGFRACCYNTLIWDMRSCSPIDVDRRFGGKYCFHFQGWVYSKQTVRRKKRSALFAVCFLKIGCSLLLKVKVVCCSETSMNLIGMSSVILQIVTPVRTTDPTYTVFI
jgi:hypothetical protein